MLKHTAAVCTAAALAAAGNGGAVAATPTAPAPSAHDPVTVHAAITPAGGHHARACSDGECIPTAMLDPGPATLNVGAARRTEVLTVTRSDCPDGRRGVGYRVSAPGPAPLVALGLDGRSAHAALRATAPGAGRSASACAA
jgi:hypothetical protein